METIPTTTASNIWQTSKFLVKGMIIAVLALLLLIPTYYVQNLVKEREGRQKEAVTEVSSKWASRQTITGPIVVLPYWNYGSETDKLKVPLKQYAYFLPDNLNVNSEVTPVKKHRGIYSVMLYSSETAIDGTFKEISPSALNINDSNIIWNEVFVKIHISDSRGLTNELSIKWKDTTLLLTPQSGDDNENIPSLSAVLTATSLNDLKDISFSTRIGLKGSEKILFTPIGKLTTVNLKSTWSDPSFTGGRLPDTSNIGKNGFTATWRSLSHNRFFPQQWKGSQYLIGDIIPLEIGAAGDTGTRVLSGYSFGADLFVPVNGYQKTMRSVKYAILCILLTFTAFFLIETVNKKSVHPLNYALIGFALILFYTLLLSFSEYIGFNTAYAIAALATVGLIAWFVRGLLDSMRLSLLLSFVLVLTYSYVFTILQLQDYALLLGSVGLFIALAIVMRFSRKIKW